MWPMTTYSGTLLSMFSGSGELVAGKLLKHSILTKVSSYKLQFMVKWAGCQSYKLQYMV